MHFAYKIGAVILFGSFQRQDKQHSGDIDIAVEFIPKETVGTEAWNKLIHSRWDLASQQGRRFPNIVERYCWDEEEVRRFLKNRSRAISIHDLTREIPKMKIDPSTPFTYTVLRGDPKHIEEVVANLTRV